MPGAAALKMVADDETGELEGVTILGQWGEIPDDFAESLQGGRQSAQRREQAARRPGGQRLAGPGHKLREGERGGRRLGL
ncbi:hypothetical protein ACN9MF_12755 [Methylobacterium fujisawaense]|uniref:hypothetical protein n=1 Tax=Methylobacterium fujisawaense TaxID=107400 RepID=UPI00313B7DC3